MRILLTVVALYLSIPVALAGEARDRLEAFATGLTLLRGEFAQYQIGSDGRVMDTSSGQLALAAPRLFRWDYLQPYEQSIVADGDNLWMLDPDLDQATVRPQADVEASSPLSVLVDLSTLDRQFNVEERGEEAGYHWLRLRSRSEEPEFAYADLAFGDAGPARLVMEDLLGQQSVIEFGDWQRNPRMHPGEFEFNLPPGVDLIGDPVSRAEAFAIPD